MDEQFKALQNYIDERLRETETRLVTEFRRSAIGTDEPIAARRVTLDEFSEYVGGLDYLNGRILTRSRVELFVGVREF